MDPHLEITELLTALCVPVGLRCCSKTLKVLNAGAVQPVRYAKARGDGHGQEDVSALREVGKLLAFLKDRSRQKVSATCLINCRSLSKFEHADKAAAWCALPTKNRLWDDVDLNRIPIMTCWPEDAAP